MASGMTSDARRSTSDTDSGDNNGDYDNDEWQDCDQEPKSSVGTKRVSGGNKKKMVQLSLVPNKRPGKKRKKRLSSNGQNGTELSDINSELKQIHDSIKQLVKKDEMKELVRSTVKEVIEEMKPKIKQEIENQLKKEMKESIEQEITEVKDEIKRVDLETFTKVGVVDDKCEGLLMDLETMRENMSKQAKTLRDMQLALRATMENANTALKLANHNQQYSQKNNIKVLNWKEKQGETSDTLKKDFIAELKKVEVTVKDDDILAIHRVPGKKKGPKPVIIKFLRNEKRLSVIRKRQDVEAFLMIDHVTERNLSLINKLRENEDLHSVWYFNCNIHAIDVLGKRHKFDVGDDNSTKLEEIRAAAKRAGVR